MLKRIGRHRTLLTEGGWVALGQVVAVIGSLLQVRVLTEFLDTTQYGYVTLALTAAVLVNQTIMGGLSNGIARFYAIAAEMKQLNAYLGASARLMRHAALAIVVLTLVCLPGMVAAGLQQWVTLLVTTLFFATLSGYNTAIGGIQNAARERRVVSIHLVADAWLKIMMAVGMIWLFGASGTSVLYGYAIAILVVTASQVVFLKKFFEIRFVGESKSTRQSVNQWAGEIWKYSRPFHLFGLFTWAQQVSDRWALQAFSGADDVGLYAVAYQLGYVPVALLTGMAINFLSPIFYGMSGAGDSALRNEGVHKLAWRITLAGLGVTLLGFVLAYFLKDLLFALLVAKKYHLAARWLPWMVLAGGLFSAGQVLAVKLMSEMRPSSLVKVKIVTAVLGVAMNVAFVYYFGPNGAVAGIVAFSAIYFFWMAFLANGPSKGSSALSV